MEHGKGLKDIVARGLAHNQTGEKFYLAQDRLCLVPQ